ncbi:MAG: glucokinase [Thermodesulfobacterium sp.]|nr:glucokinase [Thermodesulfobacterium sp.]
MSQAYLLADVGGTNARFVVLTTLRKGINQKRVLTLKSKDFSDFFSLLLEALSFFKVEPRDTVACIAVAGPVFKRRAKLTNLGWEIDERKIKAKFPFKKLILVNDLFAGSAALAKLKKKDLKLVKEGRIDKGICVAIFCGTGLGVGVLVKEKPLTLISTEAGHIFFQALDSFDLKFLDFIKEKQRELSYEEVLSGRGLENLYEFFHGERLSAPMITALAKKQDKRAGQAVKAYFKYLGRFCSQLALCYLPLGGIYLSGGVITALIDFLFEKEYKSVFMENFLSSSKLNFLLEELPIYAIGHPFPVLLGCKAIVESLEA